MIIPRYDLMSDLELEMSLMTIKLALNTTYGNPFLCYALMSLVRHEMKKRVAARAAIG
jgi:hypothetical protein